MKQKLGIALDNIKARRYHVAYESLPQIINESEKDGKEFEIFMSALVNRANCCIMLNMNEEAVSYCMKAIEKFQTLNSEQKQLTEIFKATAHLHLGQVYELQGNYVLAIKEYSLASKRLQTKEFAQHLRLFLQHIGVPEITASDDDLKPFVDLITNVNDQDILLQLVAELVDNIKKNKVASNMANKLRSRGIFKIVLSYFKLFYPNNNLISALSELAIQLIFFECEDWSGVHTLMHTLKIAPPFAFSKICDVLKMMEEKELKNCIKNGLIDILIQASEYGLRGSEASSYLLLLGFVCISQEAILKVVNPKVINYIITQHNDESVITLSRMSHFPNSTIFLEDPSNVSFVFKILRNKKPESVVSACCYILGRSMIRLNKDGKSEVYYDKCPALSDMDVKYASTIIEVLASVVSREMKSEEIISNSFMIICIASRASYETSIRLNLHHTASILLAVHKKDPYCSYNCSSYLFLLVEKGFGDCIKEITALPSNLKNIFDIHQNIAKIIEITTCLLLFLKHHDQNNILIHALRLVPDSKIIIEHAMRYNLLPSK